MLTKAEIFRGLSRLEEDGKLDEFEVELAAIASVLRGKLDVVRGFHKSVALRRKRNKRSNQPTGG